jgi:hypothetical protein
MVFSSRGLGRVLRACPPPKARLTRHYLLEQRDRRHQRLRDRPRQQRMRVTRARAAWMALSGIAISPAEVFDLFFKVVKLHRQGMGPDENRGAIHVVVHLDEEANKDVTSIQVLLGIVYQ